MAGLDAQKALQLSALLAMTAQQFTASNPGQQQLAQNLLGSAQAGIQAEALKKAKKEEDKKAKGALGGKVGALLGTAAGIALAPVTGGASLALAGAAGGALGGAAGTALSGGSPTASSALMDGLQGGMAGQSYGQAGELAKSVQNAGAPVADAAARPMAEILAQRALPPVDMLGSNPVGVSPPQQGGAMPYVAPNNFVDMKRATGNPVPMQAGMAPSANIAANAMQPKQGLGQRFFGALQGITTHKPAYRVQYGPDGTADYWPN